MKPTKWTFEKLIKIALEYKTKGEFKKGNRKAYFAATKREDYDLITSHMPNYLNRLGKDVPRVNWTHEMLRDEALKYINRIDFAKKSYRAYQAAVRMGILDKICSHMEPSKTKYKTVEDIRKEALKYNSRGEFQKSSLYHVALRRDILDEVCSHMPKRIDQSGENSPTFKWSFEEIKMEALKYNSRSEFAEGNNNAYAVACKRGIIDGVCSHMKIPGNTSRYEISLLDQIKSIYPKTQKLRDRKVKIENRPHIKGFDLDIYVPELKKAIEFDGEYWHSDAGLKRSRDHWPQEDIDNYHMIKDEWFQSKGISIIHIKEEEWIKDREFCIKKCIDFLELPV